MRQPEAMLSVDPLHPSPLPLPEPSPDPAPQQNPDDPGQPEPQGPVSDGMPMMRSMR